MEFRRKDVGEPDSRTELAATAGELVGEDGRMIPLMDGRPLLIEAMVFPDVQGHSALRVFLTAGADVRVTEDGESRVERGIAPLFDLMLGVN